MENSDLAAMLAAKMSAGVAPEVNLGEARNSPSINKTVRSGFETQRRHHHK